MALLSVRAAVAESQPLSQNRGFTDRSPLGSSGHFNSVSVGAAKPYMSRDVRPTAGVPALTSRASTPLSFVFLTPPATSCPQVLWSSVSVWFARPLELRFSDWLHPFPGSQAQSALLQVPVHHSACSPVQVATSSQHPSLAAPSPFHLSSDICAGIHGSPLRTSIVSVGDVHL